MSAQDKQAIAGYESKIEELKAQYRNTPSNQTSKLEGLRERIECFKAQVNQIKAYSGQN